MTATRVCIILLVLIAVLFAISIRVGHRQKSSGEAGLSNWQANIPTFLDRAAPVRPDEFINCPQRQGSTIVVPRLLADVSATIKPAAPGNKIRKLRVKCEGPDPFEFKFVPSTNDPLGTTIIVSCSAGTSTNLVIMENGGNLKLHRESSVGDDRIQIF